MEERDREAMQNTAGGCAVGLSMIATVALTLLVVLVSVYLFLFWTGFIDWVNPPLETP